MTLAEEIASWLREDSPVTPSPDRVEELGREMPWFLLPAALLVSRSGGSIDPGLRSRLLGRLALGAPDLDVMALAADADLAAEFARFYPEAAAPVRPSTESAIDKFINTYGTPDPHEEELLTRLIFNPTPDYAQILAREEERSAPDPDEAPKGSQDDRINNFIIKSKAVGGQFPSVEPEPEPEPEPITAVPVQKPQAADLSLPSEALAQIYIRRGKYERAYEIINQLNLNFPEKSIYFADQLRFLAKLIRLSGQVGKTGE
ncbi:MAG: hypothetical protein K2M97_02995 [Muribaculaceae bacterium]|nr:hypothetical protein [Muribaculaceae bacterium]